MAARNVVRFVKSVKVSFSTFDQRATGACEFYRQMNAGKTRSVNPKAEISNSIAFAGSAPLIQLDFINGSKQALEVPNKTVREIFDEIDFFCSQIETEYEQAGKAID